MYDFAVIDQFTETVIDPGQVYVGAFFAMVFVESWIPFVLKAFDCCFRGSAFVYLPLMMEATSAGVAILLRKSSLGLGAFRIVQSLFLEA